jgi:hypothetical protein
MSGDAKIYAVIAEMKKDDLTLLLEAYELSPSPLDDEASLRELVRIAYECGEIRSFDILAAADYAS